MNLLGLIVEYNPFHNGHLYHLNESKKITNATHTIAVMSGNFMQRGTPALLDKFTRAEMAVRNGVDLVVELPTLYACQSAEIFAHGGISLLNSLNCVNSICFGSEIGDIDILYLISKILIDEPINFKIKLKDYLDKGLPFPKARASALFYYITENKLYDTSEEDLLNMLNSPNNILGIEYIKSILKLNSKIKPYTINRINSGYNSLNDSICSASAIRNALKNNSLNTINYTMPKDTYDIINRVIDSGFNLVYNEDFYQILSSIIIRDKDNLTDYFEVNEGIENKIYNSIFKCHNIETLQNEIKSKRYTMTKISRTLNNIMLGIKGGDILKTKDLTNIPYVRVLAFNEKGCEILKEIKKNSEIEVITKFSKIKYINSNIFNTLINYDIKATNMYNLIYYKDNFDMLKAPLDYITSPKYIK
jgi:predicted nucleotidyltransferase